MPEALANLSKKLKFKLVYISTGLYSVDSLQALRCRITNPTSTRVDYVFDGTSPPYAPSAVTNPLNLYGITKRDGETAVLGVIGSQSIVLRVPVLYSIFSLSASPFAR